MEFTKEQCGICAECVPQVGGGSGYTNCADAHAAESAGDKMQLTNKQLIEHAEAQITYLRAALDIQPDVGASEMLCLMEIALKVLTAPELPQQGVKSAFAAGMARYGDAMQQLARMEGSSDAE